MTYITSSIPNYFENREPPIIYYKFVKPIRNTIIYFNKLVSGRDIHTNTLDTSDRKDSMFNFPAAGHVITGNLKVISDSRILKIVSKGPKYRFSKHIDFNK